MTHDSGRKQDGQPEGARRNRAEAVGRAEALGSLAFARAGFREPALVLRWPEIVGPDVARIAQPMKLTDGPAGGVLTLKTEPAASLFLQHQSRALCERINSFLGRPAVARLRFVKGQVEARPKAPPLPRAVPEPAAFDPTQAFAGPDPLKAALANLARARRLQRD